jgi:hypothetical protein
METAHRKPGRPKASERTAPLVLETDRNLTKIELALPGGTAKTLTEYAAWVQHCADMGTDQAITTTVDFALREVFRRDRLWHSERRIPDKKSASAAPNGGLPSPAGSTSNPGTVAPRRTAESPPGGLAPRMPEGR